MHKRNWKSAVALPVSLPWPESHLEDLRIPLVEKPCFKRHAHLWSQDKHPSFPLNSPYISLTMCPLLIQLIQQATPFESAIFFVPVALVKPGTFLVPVTCMDKLLFWGWQLCCSSLVEFSSCEEMWFQRFSWSQSLILWMWKGFVDENWKPWFWFCSLGVVRKFRELK